ncbi:Acetyltransferase (GNAT) family protein [Epibacterium ulvae]|uniref:Acetyltransferase (GNAT) family protein n=1 Tax=Epibacterium ulvae TaxID=1156985 RepID=A0A1G5QDP5_9RHOB|nr:GNAT family N-acetyltransferase [Epibacterium ulvae]SCZ59934.1 Acetyltransferase (GNAT) family protein [Epibacterium ulvae]
MEEFTYGTVSSDHASDWRDLRLEGARDFPLGFLVTLEEMAAADTDRCGEILKRGSIRGVFNYRKLIGFCGFRPQLLKQTRHRGEIGPFFVSQKYHGGGAAKTMMSGLIDEAKANKLEQLELFVDTENLRAIAFYERYGFERIATHRDVVRIDGISRNDYLYTLRI